jgi:hypothetical protein
VPPLSSAPGHMGGSGCSHDRQLACSGDSQNGEVLSGTTRDGPVGEFGSIIMGLGCGRSFCVTARGGFLEYLEQVVGYFR